MAPEMLRNLGYTYKSDIFSLGCVFFNLISGFYLFNDVSLKEKIMKNTICDISIIESYLSHTSQQCRDLLY